MPKQPVNFSDRREANRVLQDAKQALRKGLHDQAREFALRSAELDPENEESWLILGALSSPNASIEYLQTALRINPNSERARQGMLWALERTQKEKEEIQNQFLTIANITQPLPAKPMQEISLPLPAEPMQEISLPLPAEPIQEHSLPLPAEPMQENSLPLPAEPMQEHSHPLPAPLVQYHLSWQQLFTQAILAIYGYVFMEWLFFATKPSFMDGMPIGKKLEVFLLTGLVLLVLVLPVLVVLRLLGWIPGFLKKRQVFLFIGELLPAVFSAGMSVLLIDNFTYTLFKVGIVTTSGRTRGIYGLIAIILLALWYRLFVINFNLRTPAAPNSGILTSNTRPTTWQNAQSWLAVALIAVSLGISLTRTANQTNPTSEKSISSQRLPHIILLGSDGVVANRMSLYGYERDTTPRLNQLAEAGLLAENNFTNATITTGSVFSILTGKYPTQTRLLFPPNILQGVDAYQHLPGILKRAGYETMEIGLRTYVDANAINMQEGFDEVNGRIMYWNDFLKFARRFHFEDIGYFLPRLYERISDRLLHIFYIRTMPDPYHEVIGAVDPDSIPQIDDQQKIDELVRLLLNADQPTFVHVHLMGTHGPQFFPRRRVFSAGESQDLTWEIDFYDDSVLDFDAYVGELVDELTRSNLLDQTVIIIYSDHADRWRADDKIPLLFHFPQGEFAGEIHNNTQNLDIAPTLLDYLGIEVPTWMPGQSLIEGEPDSTRPILSFMVNSVICGSPDTGCVIDPTQDKPPFYQFDNIQVVICQNIYKMDLGTQVMTSSMVNDHTSPCEEDDLPSPAQVLEIIRDHLQSNGFDISTLK